MRIVSKRKLESIRIDMQKKGIDSLLLLNMAPIHDSGIEYITGFRQERNQAFGCLVFGRDRTTLLVSSLDYDQACEEASADEIIQVRKSGIVSLLKQSLGKYRRLGISESIFPLSLARKLRVKMVDFSHELLSARSIKEPGEIALIRKSCSIASHGVKVIQDEIGSAKSCVELAIILESELRRKGAEELAFPTLITSGKRGLWIHPYPSVACDRIGSTGLVDFGARVGGYCSDVTVPFARGRLNMTQKNMIHAVRDAYSRSVELLEAGAAAADVFEAADAVIASRGFEFKHSLGHGIGLDVHEYPNISPRPSDRRVLAKWKPVTLEENMVFTIEPGVYTRNGGIRLENDFLLTRRGPIQLTKSRLVEV